MDRASQLNICCLRNIASLLMFAMLSACGSIECSKMESSVYCNNIYGIVVKKYIINEGGRPNNALDVLGTDKVMHTISPIHYERFDSIAVNDSLSKAEHSFNFSFFRNDTLRINFNYDMSCLCDSPPTIMRPIK
jgi:uncharacterized protein YceK